MNEPHTKILHNLHIHTSEWRGFGARTEESEPQVPFRSWGKTLWLFPVLIIMGQFIYYPVPSYLNLDGDGWMHWRNIDCCNWLCETCPGLIMIFKRIPPATTDTFCLSILALSISFENSAATSFSVCVNLCRSEVIIERVKYPDTNVRQEMMCDKLRTTDKVRFKSRFWENL